MRRDRFLQHMRVVDVRIRSPIEEIELALLMVLVALRIEVENGHRLRRQLGSQWRLLH